MLWFPRAGGNGPASQVAENGSRAQAIKGNRREAEYSGEVGKRCTSRARLVMGVDDQGGSERFSDLPRLSAADPYSGN